MKGNLEKITRGEEHPGGICAVCQNPIEPEDKVVVCPRCKQVHHEECWKSKGGCGKAGCPQIARAVVGDPPVGDGPPPPVSKRTIVLISAAILALILLTIFWPKPPDPAGDRLKIVFLGEAHYELSSEMTDLAEEFNALNTEIYVDLQLLPPGAMEQKLVILIAAQEAPDIMALTDERFAYFVQQGALLALDEDETGKPIFGIQHPAQLTQLAIWAQTAHGAAALEVLHYFASNIHPVDLDELQEQSSTPFPLFGL